MNPQEIAAILGTVAAAVGGIAAGAGLLLLLNGGNGSLNSEFLGTGSGSGD